MAQVKTTPTEDRQLQRLECPSCWTATAQVAGSRFVSRGCHILAVRLPGLLGRLCTWGLVMSLRAPNEQKQSDDHGPSFWTPPSPPRQGPLAGAAKWGGGGSAGKPLLKGRTLRDAWLWVLRQLSAWMQLCFLNLRIDRTPQMTRVPCTWQSE